jgi:hypothetical protein
MSTAAVNVLPVLFLALLAVLLSAMLAVVLPRVRLSREAKQALRSLTLDFEGELRAAAARSARAVRRHKINRRDIRAEYEKRIPYTTFALAGTRSRVGGFAYAVASLGLAVPPLPFFSPLPVTAGQAVAILTALFGGVRGCRSPGQLRARAQTR